MNIMATQSQSNKPKLSENITTLLYQSPQRNLTNLILIRKKTMIDTPVLKKIKAIQLSDLQNWKGLQVEYISRPGKIKILN